MNDPDLEFGINLIPYASFSSSKMHIMSSPFKYNWHRLRIRIRINEVIGDHLVLTTPSCFVTSSWVSYRLLACVTFRIFSHFKKTLKLRTESNNCVVFCFNLRCVRKKLLLTAILTLVAIKSWNGNASEKRSMCKRQTKGKNHFEAPKKSQTERDIWSKRQALAHQVEIYKVNLKSVKNECMMQKPENNRLINIQLEVGCLVAYEICSMKFLEFHFSQRISSLDAILASVWGDLHESKNLNQIVIDNFFQYCIILQNLRSHLSNIVLFWCESKKLIEVPLDTLWERFKIQREMKDFNEWTRLFVQNFS